MESIQEVLERRYASRAVSRRRAEAEAREATRGQNPQAVTEAFARAARDLGACIEIAEIARELSVDLDNDSLAQRIRMLESESEQAAQALGEEL